MTDWKIEAPIKVEIKVIVVNDKGDSGEVTCELPSMEFPTQETVIKAIKEVSKNPALAANDLRIANQRETFDYMTKERIGADMTFALPGSPEDWYE
ncbi:MULTISPECIES: hypothetical protein [Pseudoalteromonas]|uniref:hypothetical protein n=1 Tax=Pseudoalteromonas TaxID=53246 RepID=UPI0002CC41B0|nr:MULTISPECIES: hypothetical protein [Pseudoalteromonas]ENN99811.1 hypothetical protein J139_04380 [Pseudoalteromonas agarivorans S816]TMS64724.1 hypothetical protein CWB83_15655 [Pseudoalteromonas sp. S1691]TMS72394.1 hypothetical protein CWB86_01790 [Pseudoalteromonas sp. S1731]TMS73451.1 hypothetical protein CWB88_11755 [Pseudoalteromonas sp. S1941]TMS76360.1 hypothetical protein CWB82_17075 [Pseudoalteromonas sp. S1690]|tara:strand:+ start:277 stop:564 length:288 start_codon:yes stop_codon:yes gene_type:complete